MPPTEEEQPLLRDDVESPITEEEEAAKKAFTKKVFMQSIVFFLVTMAMNQMNITLIIAISESISKQNHEPLVMSGLMVGLVGLGGILGLFPFTMYFQKYNFKMGFVVHSLCALFGGLMSLFGTEYNVVSCIYIGRVILGLSDSVNTLSYYAIHTLAPFEEKTFYLLLGNVMSGVGCASGPFLSSLLTKYADGTKTLHMRTNAGLPITVTVAYSIIMFFAVVFVFPSNATLIKAGLYDQKKNNKVSTADSNLTYEERVKKGSITAATVLFVTFTRTCIRFCWETGAMSVLMNGYALQENAGYIVGGIIAVLPLYTFTLSMMSRKYGDKYLLTVLEALEISGAFLLFRMSHTMSTFWLCLFVCGSTMLYYNNSGQSGILSSVLLKNAVPGHKYLDSVRLLAIYNACAMLGVISGPLISRAVLQVMYTQNMLAIVLFAFCVVQTGTITAYFCYYHQQETKAKSDPALPSDPALKSQPALPEVSKDALKSH